MTMRRPLPDFQRWLEKTSPGTLAPDFEAFADFARRTEVQDISGLQPHEQTFARMLTGAAIAAVEICNAEALTHQRPAAEIIAMLPRAFACSSMYAIASVCESDTPFRSLAKVITEEFRMAAKTAADQLVKQEWEGKS